MAEIFLARTRGPSGFEKLVVLKKILPRYAERQRYVQLFLDEARLGATLDHPNIVQVYDIGMDDGSYFFTMEFLHGQDLRSILHRTWRTGETFPIEHAVQIARHVASALHFAHGRQRDDGSLLGIVHRDVSPSNIVVTYDGATKLLDFGVAKTAASSVKTRTGTLKGKIAYMSPEQARGAPIDRRSDVFSLGIVLWEMVTTQRLYRADNDLATLQKIIHEPPRPPTAVRPECPPELERIVLRALAEDPEARYQTAEQLVNDLDELAREHKLKQSPSALASILGQLFGAELAAWREARAAGVPLADHLHDAGDMTTPVSESDFIEADAGLDDDDDELDDDEDDDDLTEHAAPIVEPLPPLSGAFQASPPLRPSEPELATDHDTVMLPMPRSRASTPNVAFAAVTAPIDPRLRDMLVKRGKRDTAGGPAGPSELTRPNRPPEPRELEEPGVTAGHDVPDDLDAPTIGTPAVRMASMPASMAASPSALAPPPSTPSSTPVSVPLSSLAATTTSSVRFAVPPWQSGQPASPPINPSAGHAAAQAVAAAAAVAAGSGITPPGGPGSSRPPTVPPTVPPTAPPGERTGRSWAVVSLPPFDAEVFERRRRLVLRVAGGVIGFILLLAIIVGQC
jgi:serine/threonine protein kinase